ncbi:MAG: diacylglycerol kinase family lipid kinase [Acidimicrobiia bacterium]|nr:diacylglycerol kinase family lipid kinase [Acidimicrobiia bacterium]
MRILLIVNATASSVTTRMRIVIRKALAADHDLEVAETSRRGHAARLARAAARDGVDVVAVLAGDGTLNEAADGLAGTATALAPLPGGSTNDYARSLGVPNDPNDATAALLTSLERGSVRRVGLGAAGGRHFLFHAGIGFDAAVIEQVERRSSLKRYAAHPLFLAAAVDTWLRRYDHRRGRFRVELPGGDVIDDLIFAIVSKTSPYTYLGKRPVVIAPSARLDSALALTAFRVTGMTTVVRCGVSALLTGRRLRRHPDLAHRDGITRLSVTSDDPFPWQVDGDYLGETTRLDFEHRPGALRLVVPVDGPGA